MYKYTILESKSGREVYVNLIDSVAGHYLSRQPYVIALIREVLLGKPLKNSTLVLEEDMGRIIGNTDIIETTEKDTIYYAKPTKQTIFSRYAKNRFPKPSRKLTLHLLQDSSGDYEITDVWIGPNCPPFPGSTSELSSSKTYWETHALVQDSQPLQHNSITKVCPY